MAILRRFISGGKGFTSGGKGFMSGGKGFISERRFIGAPIRAPPPFQI
jgi:hypothetical protein